MKIATICFHKNLFRYPKKWIDDYRLSIENQLIKTPIYEIDYGVQGERIFKDSIYIEQEFTNHADAHNYLCHTAIKDGFDYVANTNIDDLYHQERISRQIEYLDGNDVISCDMTQIDGDNNVTRADILFSQMNIKEHAEKGHNILAHPAAIYSKRFIEESGMLIPAEIPKDDFNLWKRSYDKFNFFIAPFVLLYYRIHANNISKK